MYQGLTYLEIAGLMGSLIFIVVVAAVIIQVGSFLIKDIFETTVGSMVSRQLIRSKRLVVSRKKHIAPNEIVKEKTMMWDKDTPAGTLVRTAPVDHIWAILAEIPFGPFIFHEIVIAVEQPVWLELAPGDEMDNPHFGGIKQKAIVDPSIQEWIHQTA